MTSRPRSTPRRSPPDCAGVEHPATSSVATDLDRAVALLSASAPVGLDVEQARIVALARLRSQVEAALTDALAASPVVGGLPTGVLLATDAGMVASERDAMQLIVAARSKLPSLDDAARSGALSSSQIRAVATTCGRLRPDTCAIIDEYLPDLIARSAGVEADWIRRQVIDLVDLIHTRPLERAEDRAERDEHLRLQPDLFGGGRIDGRFAAESFQLLSAALDRRMQAETLDRTELQPSGSFDSLAARTHNGSILGTARAAALMSIVADELAGSAAAPVSAAVPTMLVTTTLDALAGMTDEPGKLLTTMTGGAVNVSARNVRRWADRGARVRLIVHDEDGNVAGVGRLVHHQPDWLRDTVRAMFPTCVIPGCEIPAARSDLDHHVPFDHDDPTNGGATSVDNSGWLCRTHHREKTAGSWAITTDPHDGSRVITHLATNRRYRQPNLLDRPTPPRRCWTTPRSTSPPACDDDPPAYWIDGINRTAA